MVRGNWSLAAEGRRATGKEVGRKCGATVEGTQASLRLERNLEISVGNNSDSKLDNFGINSN
jgi:hypothetical protein